MRRGRAAPARGALDAASGGANRRDRRAPLRPRRRRAGSPASEHGRGEAYPHQEREGGDGAAHHRPGMADAGQAGGNDSAGNAEPDQADCDSHGNHGSSRGVGPIAGPKSIFALSHPADADTPKRRSPHRLGYTLTCHFGRFRVASRTLKRCEDTHGSVCGAGARPGLQKPPSGSCSSSSSRGLGRLPSDRATCAKCA